MVTITQPLSAYVDNNDSSTYTLKWSNSQYTGQYAIEILYKTKTSETWLTTGKIETQADEYDLRNLHTLTGVDLDEIQYRLIVYYKTSDGIETRDFSDAAYIYSLIFNPGSSESLRIYDGRSTSEYPLFSDINNPSISKMTIKTKNGIKALPLVNADSPIAGNAKIVVGENGDKAIKSFATNEPNFTYDTSRLTTYGTAEAYSVEPVYAQNYDGKYYNTLYENGYTSYYGNKAYTTYSNNYGYTRYDNNVGYRLYHAPDTYYYKTGHYIYYKTGNYSHVAYKYSSSYYYLGVHSYKTTGYYYSYEARKPVGYPKTDYYYGNGSENYLITVYTYGPGVVTYKYDRYYTVSYRGPKTYAYTYYFTAYGPRSDKYAYWSYLYKYESTTAYAPTLFYADTYGSGTYYLNKYSQYYYSTYGYYKYNTYSTYYYRTDSAYNKTYYTVTPYSYYYLSGYEDRSYNYRYQVN